jgi:hypothetical protein
MNQEKVVAIIAEEVKAINEYAATHGGMFNSGEFEKLVRCSLASADVRRAVAYTAAGVATNLILSFPASGLNTPDDLLRMFESDRTVFGYIDRALLDFLWIGYRLGRRLQREEDETALLERMVD